MALTDNILAYWNLNDDGSGNVSLVDDTGNGYTLTNNNGATLATGKIDGCASLSASLDTYLNSAGFSGSSGFSFSCWINATDYGTGGYSDISGYIVDARPCTSLGFSNSGNLYVGNPSSEYPITPVPLNEWVHLVVTASSTETKVYQNGSLIITAGGATSFDVSSIFLGCPSDNTGGDFHFNGLIDEVGTWSRALSATEVYNLYYNGTGNTYPFSKTPIAIPLSDGCKAYWNLNDDGFGNVSLVDSTGNGYALSNPNGVTLGTGIISGDAVFNPVNQQYLGPVTLGLQNQFSVSFWAKWNGSTTGNNQVLYTSPNDLGFQSAITTSGNFLYAYWSTGGVDIDTGYSVDNNWHNYVLTKTTNGDLTVYVDGSVINTNNIGQGGLSGFGTQLGSQPSPSLAYYFDGQIDEVGTWDRVLSQSEVTKLYNNGSGITYPFTTLYYNNAQSDGDWGNLLNWWQDSGFTIQATALPDNTTPINLYNQVTQNTQGANQCFCASAFFWSADFAYGLTLQSTGVVNMQGSSIMAGATTDSVSMHDSSTLTDVSVVDGNVTMRDSSRAFGTVVGNATIYYDNGNGQYPIGGTVGGTVTYLGWPAISPQWFNDKVTGGGNDGDFSNKANWWTSNTYSVRPINAEGTQELPDASTDVFIAPNTGIVANSGTANPTINSVTANDSNIQNISITATNGFLFSGNEGVANAVLYGNVIFQDTAYNDHAVIQGKATYKSAASLQYSWGQNSLGNVNAGMYNGSTAFEVNISGGGAGNFISRLLHLPWFINI